MGNPKNNHPGPMQTPKRVITERALAERMGCRLSTLRRLLEASGVAPCHPGCRRRGVKHYDMHDIEQFIGKSQASDFVDDI